MGRCQLTFLNVRWRLLIYFQLKMDPFEREWRRSRIMLDLNKHEWIHNVLPRNMVPDDLKGTIEHWFTIVYGHFEDGVKDATKLQIIKEDNHILVGYLTLANLMSNMQANLRQY